MAMTPKELKALASACRKAGITSYKGDGVEFTLSPEPAKVRRYKSKPEATIQVQGPSGVVNIPAPVNPKDDEIPTDALSDDALLFWSVSDEATQ